MEDINKVTTIILAGGKNLRLGRNKAIENIGNITLIERVVKRLRPLTNQYIIVTSGDKFELPSPCQAVMLADIYYGKGPLGGIYTGLLTARSSTSIVVACDMPFLNSKLLNYMLQLSIDYDAVVPRLDNGMIEPLHAIYSKSCLEKMKERLESDQLKVHRFLDTIRVRYVERAECQEHDPKLLSFFNINYQEDLDRAIELDSNGN
jgi:molybdopterin-guanine dinucleotide biosynthesis protein A